MTFIPMVADWWFGLCPKHPVMRTAPAVLMVPPEYSQSARPDGDPGGAARIRTGAGIALLSVTILRQNKQLLWFSYMTGIVMALVFISQYILRILSVYPYDAIDAPRWFILTFAIELAGVFCLTMLTAGLVLGLSHREDGEPASFYNGICRTREFLHPLADWAVIMALLAIAIYIILSAVNLISGYYTHVYFSFVLYPVLNLFPFDFIILPENHHIGPLGGTYAMSTAVTSTAAFSAINGILFLLTMFVIPLVVLERKSLREAVTGSAMLMKKVLYEALSCSILLVLVVSAAAAAALLFPVAYGIVAPGRLHIYYPGDGWIAAAVLFIFALYGLTCIVTTIAGIAVTDLYSRSAGSGDREAIRTGHVVDAAPEPAI